MYRTVICILVFNFCLITASTQIGKSEVNEVNAKYNLNTASGSIKKELDESSNILPQNSTQGLKVNAVELDSAQSINVIKNTDKILFNGKTPYVSEGGKINDQSSSEHVKYTSVASVKDKGGTEVIQQTYDNQANPVDGKPPMKSSVVPRKGAPSMEPIINDGNGNITSQTKNDSYKIINNKDINNNKTEENTSLRNNSASNSKENHLLQIRKKPESASDFTQDDVDGFSFIESSSTGKDYVLTGIAIFVCIWAIIFGALFFYKRAGELWDRRHYRRMDFLVEGMYND